MANQTPFRFRLRSILIGVALVALLLTLYLKWRDWTRWRPHREFVDQYFGELAQWDQQGGKVGVFTSGDEQFVLSAEELKIRPQGGTMSFKGAERRPGEVWVWPPGTWVPDQGEALRVLRRHLAD